MPDLYFTPTSCGAASYIAAKAGGVEFANKYVVSLQDHKVVKTGEDFYKINPKGNVPAIKLDSGKIINENVGTLYYIGKNAKRNNTLGKTSEEEYQVVNALGYIASEVHQGIGPLFSLKDEAARKAQIEKYFKKLEYVEKAYFSDGQQFLVGDSFTVADSYLYISLTWPAFINVDITQFKLLDAFKQRVAALDFVKEAHKEMGELEKAQKA